MEQLFLGYKTGQYVHDKSEQVLQITHWSKKIRNQGKDISNRNKRDFKPQQGLQIGAKQCIVISALLRFHRKDDLICYVLQKFSKFFLIIVQNFTIHSNIVQIKSDGLFYTFCLFKSWSPDQSECTKNCHS